MKFTRNLLLILSLNFVFLNESISHAESIKEVHELDQLIKRELTTQGAISSVSIRSASTGDILYNHMGNTRLRPASNLKLFTAAAALSVLGEDYRFHTELLTDGKTKWNILNGNLYIKGKGDPTLLKSDIDQMVQELKEKDIRIIRGDLIADDTWFDHVRYSVDLPWTDETTYYGAQVSALTVSPNKDYDAGTIEVEVTPGDDVKSPAKVKLYPRNDYVNVVNLTETVADSTDEPITITRKHGTNTIMIKGHIPQHSVKMKEHLSVWEPTGLVLDLVENSLNKHGIMLLGDTKFGKTPELADKLVTHPSIPLSELLVPFMKLSNNLIAETLVKEMGKVVRGEGTWENGLEIMEKKLTQFGVNPDTLILRDGSGISHVNLIPAHEITKLLYAVQNEKWFNVYMESLPVAGISGKMVGGTLRNRMKHGSVKGKVWAKTGTLSTVSSVSGYLKTNNDERLIFSIILNNVLDEAEAKKLEDELVQKMVQAFSKN